MKKNTFHIVSLGCAKNTVDSTSIGNILLQAGYSFCADPKQAEVILVNTCAFIQPAREEAIDTILEISKIKKSDQLFFAVGCMAERHAELLMTTCPKLDGLLGTNKISEILSLIQIRRPLPKNPHPSAMAGGAFSQAGASAYLKIADGCSRQCAFCSIPLIKGPWRSRTENEIIHDATLLAGRGVKELVLVAQDTTAYGADRGEKDALPTLLEHLMIAVPQMAWIRILYAFPGFVSDRLIDLMAANNNILPYLDIPLQHAHPDVLKRMLRPHDMGWVRSTIAKMRERIPDLAIRSTFIAGFPGESESEFEALENFLTEMKFDRVGVFPYYFEAGTPSAKLLDDVSSEEKMRRVEKLMLRQQKISTKINRSLIGKQLDVLVEGVQDGLMVGRSYRDAPEIDGLVFAEGTAALGTIAPVKITNALEYDLIGRFV